METVITVEGARNERSKAMAQEIGHLLREMDVATVQFHKLTETHRDSETQLSRKIDSLFGELEAIDRDPHAGFYKARANLVLAKPDERRLFKMLIAGRPCLDGEKQKVLLDRIIDLLARRDQVCAAHADDHYRFERFGAEKRQQLHVLEVQFRWYN